MQLSEAAKILCIEDEQCLLEDLVEELEDAGYEVFAGKNGKEGLDLIKSKSPDLVLCDMMMPVMDGPQVLSQMRLLPDKAADTPFIFLTAKATTGDIIEGKNLGADDYLTKPVDYDLLLATLSARLNQVDRMKERTEKEMVLLYQALSTQGNIRAKYSANGFKVAMIAPGNHGLKTLNDGLVMMGCDIVYFHSLESLQKNAEACVAPRVAFVHDTVDLSDNVVEMVRLTFRNPQLPVHVLSTATSEYTPGIYDKFDTNIPPPYHPKDVFKAIMTGL